MDLLSMTCSHFNSCRVDVFTTLRLQETASKQFYRLTEDFSQSVIANPPSYNPDLSPIKFVISVVRQLVSLFSGQCVEVVVHDFACCACVKSVVCCVLSRVMLLHVAVLCAVCCAARCWESRCSGNMPLSLPLQTVSSIFWKSEKVTAQSGQKFVVYSAVV